MPRKFRLPRADILYLNRKPFDDVDFDLPVEVCGIKFRNPFFVSSGPTTMLLSQLNRLRTQDDSKPETARHIREGANLAVKLAELLQRVKTSR